MNLIVCVDNQNGMSFNNRRQSRDRAVIEKICDIAEGNTLLISSYSAMLFQETTLHVCISDNFYEQKESACFFFIEREDARLFLENTDKIFMFRWNRDYPSDLKFPMDAVLAEFKLSDCFEFEGNSHPLITLEVYER